MKQTLYILKYTLSGFELCEREIVANEDLVSNNPYITHLLTSGRTNIVRTTKLNKVTVLGGFNFVAYFTDKDNYSRLKASMCDLIDKELRIQESQLYKAREQYKEFLYAKLGGNL